MPLIQRRPSPLPPFLPPAAAFGCTIFRLCSLVSVDLSAARRRVRLPLTRVNIAPTVVTGALSLLQTVTEITTWPPSCAQTRCTVALVRGSRSARCCNPNRNAGSERLGRRGVAVSPQVTTSNERIGRRGAIPPAVGQRGAVTVSYCLRDEACRVRGRSGRAILTAFESRCANCVDTRESASLLQVPVHFVKRFENVG